MTTHTTAHDMFDEAVQAIAGGSIDRLRSALDASPGLVTATDQSTAKATLLHYTSFNGFPEVSHPTPPETPELAQLLIDRGADVDATAFDNAAATPLSWAVSSWFPFQTGVIFKLIDVYLQGGARIEGLNNDGAPLGHAIGFGYTRSVEHLAIRGARTNHLLAAAALGDLERIRAWHRDDGSFDEQALSFVRCDEPQRGRFSWPPPSEPDPAAIALITAATHGRARIVQYLLDRGVDPNRAVSFDQTALHFAAYAGHQSIVELLLECGADKAIRERQFDRTAAQWARETDEHQLAELIERA